MAVKNISTRMKICGRSEKCTGGHSAVEQASYISREKMYCGYDGRTYYPKYIEDLVHAEVMLSANAPPEYQDPCVLWNAVENMEKGEKAQLARTYRVELPNEWSYELATEVMRDYVKRNFVDEGMCAQFAIHDSENRKTGQRNLHCHILLTMRGIDEQGKWMPKQKKVYLTDENGERIPLIDKKTGRQKVDNQNRRQWKCATIPTNDWSSKENAKKWRKDLADTINAVNERIGETDNIWEHRSFKEQGLDILPQIHLGEKASALERNGIQTIRGNINREILANNAIVIKARAVYELAKKELEEVRAIPVKAVALIRNEILDMIQEVARRNSNRLKLPIVKGRYLGKISNRATLQRKDFMENFVHKMGWISFEDMKVAKQSMEHTYDTLINERTRQADRISYLTELLEAYKDYEPYIKYHKEQWALKGWERKKYERRHLTDLVYYDTYREKIKSMINGDDKRILPKAWRAELDRVTTDYYAGQESYAELVQKLACCEVLEHNRKEFDRMLENENSKNGRAATKTKKEPTL